MRKMLPRSREHMRVGLNGFAPDVLFADLLAQ